MNKKALLVLSISMLVAALSVPLMAQTFMLKANIPFEFTVGNKVLPAGDYLIRSGGGSSVLFLQGAVSHADVLTLTFPKELGATNNPAGITKLTFDRYGNHYFLSEVDDGFVRTGFVLPMTHTQRELAKTASFQHNEIVTVLAQR
jgi:hypothetical protein